ncbi:uncharacterized protein EAE98_003015 [Botrytis deweyae]|uniref:Heterokaryon incompatibility domain-containing protein n=1 Tax=Botrytis deweyae TaxID=2478750 RepID=A0ABQ7IVC5_9HELO|nr:uncharacterized protein EAE98_003015 [Botrytis deweyae]KAF7934970.1 hypothetical protein EAE98_003015 [Botrytis deweyae]
MKRFSYKPLDPLVDGTRLLHLLPGSSTQQPRCSLKHVNFGGRPKYNAVSYTWGNEANQKPIVIEDRYFLVTENLYKALICLQQQSATEYVLWVDAICINQDDVAERNRQLTIMPYIYERAKLVIIWLRNDENTSPPTAWPDPEKISPFELSGHTQQYKDQRSLFNYLMVVCSNEYWKRLWIIQEIGKARKLIIFFGQELIDWQRFVETITLDWPYPAWITQETMEENALSQTVPWNLYYQLRNKYDGAHKLQNLMANHRQALCKEPRDKVYGLVGLATDCYAGFPMDYRKSLYEVWKDTVIFRNSDTRVDQSDILKFGKLVRDSLGGPNITTMNEIADDVFLKIPQKSSLEQHLGVSNPTVLKVPARLVGRIVHLGPSYVQIMTELSKTADWRLSIQNHLPDRLQPSVQEESDLFLELLEDLDETGLKIVSTCGSDVSWFCYYFPGENAYPFDRPTNRDIGDESQLRNSSFHSSSERSEPLPPAPGKGARLFLLDKYDGYLPVSNDTLANMGLGPSAARVGDYLCEIDGIKKAAVIRRTKTKLSFIGTAGLAQKPQDARKSKNSTLEETSSPFGLPRFENLKNGVTVDLHLYVPLAYQLLD